MPDWRSSGFQIMVGTKSTLAQYYYTHQQDSVVGSTGGPLGYITNIGNSVEMSYVFVTRMTLTTVMLCCITGWRNGKTGSAADLESLLLWLHEIN